MQEIKELEINSDEEVKENSKESKQSEIKEITIQDEAS